MLLRGVDSERLVRRLADFGDLDLVALHEARSSPTKEYG